MERHSGEPAAAAERALREAHAAGAKQAEAFVSSNDYRVAEMEKSEVKRASVIRDAGLGVRVLVRGGTGSSSTTDLSASGIRVCAREAVRTAKLSTGDPKVTRFALPGRLSDADLAKYDPGIAALPAAWLVDLAGKCLREARRADKRVVVNGGMAWGTGCWWIANSNGVSAGSRGTIVEAGFSTVVRCRGDVGTFYDFSVSRSLRAFDPLGAARKAAEGAARYLGSRTVGTADLPVVLGPQAASGLLASIAYAANAESVQYRRSFLAGKRGQRVASELVEMVDDHLYPGGTGSSLCDAEGTPTRRTAVVSGGVLRTYLYNNTTAMKDGVESTGHASRGGYGGGVGIGPGNLRVTPGRGTLAELIADTGEGIFIDMGSLSPDQVTGTVSTTVDFGFKIERGKLKYPLKTTMLGGQVQDWLLGIDRVAAETREDAGTLTPALRIRRVRIAGGKQKPQ